jgi:integrase
MAKQPGRKTQESTQGTERVQLRKHGKYYHARFTDNAGKRHEVGLGRCTVKRTAQDKALAIHDALDRGEPWEVAIDRAPAGALTFAQLVVEFLEKYDRWSENTRRGTRSAVNQLVEEFGHRLVNDIRSQDIEGYLARRRDAGMTSKASRNRLLAALKSIFRKAHEWGYVPRDPAAAVKMLKEGYKQPAPLTQEEVCNLLDALEPSAKRVAEIYLQTGMRLGELTRLQWADVDFEARTVTLRNTKNQTDRTVPMSRRVYEIMREVKAQNNSSDTPSLGVLGCEADILTPLRHAAEQAGFEEGRQHRLQHRLRDTAATTMLDRGVALDRVQAILGHKTLSMTRRYAETRSEHLRTAIAQAFDDALGASPGEATSDGR